MKTLKEFLNESKKSMIRLNFNNKKDFSKAVSVLTKNNFGISGYSYNNTNNIDGWITVDNHWECIDYDIKYDKKINDLLKSLKLDFTKEAKEPRDYVILKQGGYLD